MSETAPSTSIVKDGIVLREEQLAKYPQINPNVPDANPRGCQKGAIHSSAMYEGDRLRYPMKRVGKRGEGKWKRMEWDEITEEIADKVIDIFVKHGPGKLMTHTGSGNLSMVRLRGALSLSHHWSAACNSTSSLMSAISTPARISRTAIRWRASPQMPGSTPTTS